MFVVKTATNTLPEQFLQLPRAFFGLSVVFDKAFSSLVLIVLDSLPKNYYRLIHSL